MIWAVGDVVYAAVGARGVVVELEIPGIVEHPVAALAAAPVLSNQMLQHFGAAHLEASRFRVLLCGPCNQLKSHLYTLSGLRKQNRKHGYMANHPDTGG